MILIEFSFSLIYLEMKMSAELKLAKREKELKHKRDKSSLDEIREEIVKEEKHLEELKNQKDRLFADFKKVLTEDEARKNMQRAREAAFNNITFSTPSSADLPKPYQSAIVTVANTPSVPSVVSSQTNISQTLPPAPGLSLNGQQIFYPPHLQQLATPTKNPPQPPPAVNASPTPSLQLRRDPTPQSHLATPPNSKPLPLSQPSHLQQSQHQNQPLMLSKPPPQPPTHHSQMPLHPPGFPGILQHSQALPQQAPQSFVHQNMPDRGRVSITGKRSHEQSNAHMQQLQGPPPPQAPSMLSGANSFLTRVAPSQMVPPGALHGHPNGKSHSFMPI